MLIRIKIENCKVEGPGQPSAALFRPVPMGRRWAFRGPLLSGVIHCLLIFAVLGIGEWIPESETAWFDPSASITYLRGGGPAHGVLYFAAVHAATGSRGVLEPGRPSGNRIRHPQKITPLRRQLPSMLIAPPPDVSPSQRPRVQELQEPAIVALATHISGEHVIPPGPPTIGAGAADSTSQPSLRYFPQAAARGSDPGGQSQVDLSFDPGRPVAAPALSARQPAVEKEVRLVHPEDGQFDVVLLQAAPDSTMQLLRGAPIYSVYLDVGTQKQWMLHFCAPEPNVEITEHVVRIGAVEPITAPYPRITVVPGSFVPGNAGDPLAVSGVIDEEGHLSHLSAFHEKDQDLVTRLISSFGEWLFRPAKRRGTPVAVQVVLVIPAGDDGVH